MIIGFTALFHAIFERDKIAYWYTKDDGSLELVDGDPKAWEISKCVQTYFKADASPQRENLKFFVAIRNKIEHRFVPPLDLKFAGKCQALLMNYEDLLVQEFGEYFALGANLALALQFSKYSREQQAVLRKIQTDEYEAIKSFSDAYDALLPSEIQQSLSYSFRAFLIPDIGNHKSSSDIAIRFVPFDSSNPEEMAEYQKHVAFLRDREKEVPIANLGNLRPSDVVQKVRNNTGLEFKISHHTNAWKLYGVRPRTHSREGCQTQYCIFDETFNSFVYTPKWVDFLCTKVAVPDEFEKIRSYRDPK